MSDIKCIIVEDEPLAAKVLSDYIAQVPFLNLQGTFKDAILASEYLRQHATDLIFLDIHLPRLRGMDFLRTLINPPQVIVTTAYHQYAVEGFDLNVADYLLKPFAFERFLLAISKIKIAQAAKLPSKESAELKEYLFVSVQKKKVRISFSDILYIESQKEYIRIVTTKNEYLSKMSTHEIESLLPTHQFRRIHRSFIVSTGKIDSYTADMVEVNGLSIPIGRGYRDVIDDI